MTVIVIASSTRFQSSLTIVVGNCRYPSTCRQRSALESGEEIALSFTPRLMMDDTSAQLHASVIHHGRAIHELTQQDILLAFPPSCLFLRHYHPILAELKDIHTLASATTTRSCYSIWRAAAFNNLQRIHSLHDAFFCANVKKGALDAFPVGEL